MVVECPWLSAAPIAAPMCMSGPSGPTGSPLATTRPHDSHLTPSVATLNSWEEGRGGEERAKEGGEVEEGVRCPAPPPKTSPSPPLHRACDPPP